VDARQLVLIGDEQAVRAGRFPGGAPRCACGGQRQEQQPVHPRYLFCVLSRVHFALTNAFGAARAFIAGGAFIGSGALTASGALMACRDAQPAADAPLPVIKALGGPETVLLRIPRQGGTPRSYRWPSLDEPAWEGANRLPAVRRVLAFDELGGTLALAFADGRSGRLDLRTGRIQSTNAPVNAAVSADGAAIFALTSDRHIIRTTATTDWRGPEVHSDTLLALPNGYVVLVSHAETTTRLVRFHPPSLTPMDTVELPRAGALVRTVNGDRIYAQTERGVAAVDARTWRNVSGPRTRDLPLALAPTPSGDRVFVLEENGRDIRVWDRYADRYRATIHLSSPVAGLRMDVMGRYLLGRIETGDSVRILSVPLGRVIATVQSEWRNDLPAFAPDGSLLTLTRGDVNVLDPVSSLRRKRIRNGAQDIWVLVRWDGFRPRDSSLDAPATFDDLPFDSLAAADRIDSILAARGDRLTVGALDSIARASAAAERHMQTDTASSGTGFVLSFAALLSETSARSLAGRIHVDGQTPRVVRSTSDGVTIFRVILGPYPTRDAAEAAGRRSGVPYWIYTGMP
jgi:hypothetical protein